MKAEKMPIASTEIVIIIALDCRKMLAMPATSTMIMPMNRNLPIADRSRLITVESVAMPRKIAPVPANAVMMSPAPLFRPSTAPIRRDSIRPMKNVNASSTGTPAAEFLVFSIANMNANAPPRKTIALMPWPITLVMPVVTPIHAPSTVGTIDSASSQYVLRSTRLRCSTDVTSPA